MHESVLSAYRSNAMRALLSEMLDRVWQTASEEGGQVLPGAGTAPAAPPVPKMKSALGLLADTRTEQALKAGGSKRKPERATSLDPALGDEQAGRQAGAPGGPAAGDRKRSLKELMVQSPRDKGRGKKAADGARASKAPAGQSKQKPLKRPKQATGAGSGQADERVSLSAPRSPPAAGTGRVAERTPASPPSPALDAILEATRLALDQLPAGRGSTAGEGGEGSRVPGEIVELFGYGEGRKGIWEEGMRKGKEGRNLAGQFAAAMHSGDNDEVEGNMVGEERGGGGEEDAAQASAVVALAEQVKEGDAGSIEGGWWERSSEERRRLVLEHVLARVGRQDAAVVASLAATCRLGREAVRHAWASVAVLQMASVGPRGSDQLLAAVQVSLAPSLLLVQAPLGLSLLIVTRQNS